jgi:uncharacterized protein (TIGR02996 family)
MAVGMTKADERLIQAECDRLPGDAAEAPFRAALEEAPHDATTRLVLADWLAEQGRPDDERIQRLLGTRAVLVRDRRRTYPTDKAVWDVFVREDDPLAGTLDGEYVTCYEPATVEDYRSNWAVWPGYLEHAAARLGPPFVRHCYHSPAEAEADLLRAYKALLQREGAGDGR